MKVKDLLAQLYKLDPELEVKLATDGEGNGFWPLYTVEPAQYSSYNVSVYPMPDNWVDEDWGPIEEAPDDLEEVVILWP